MVKIPSVIGKTKSSAKSTLESAGFSVTFEYGDYNDSVAADVVTAQSPSAKKQAAKGSTVTVTLSPGQKPITVPNVVGAHSHMQKAPSQEQGSSTPMPTPSTATQYPPAT